MPTGPKTQKPASPQAGRQERLAQALRDNLKKRKAQQRAQEDRRRAGQQGQAGGGPQGAGPDGGGGDGS